MNTSQQISTVAALLTERMTKLGKTPSDIATETSAPSDRVISMIAAGAMKLPFSLVKPLAQALDIDAMYLMRMTLKEYSPDLLQAVDGALQRSLINKKEYALIEKLREIAGDRDVQSILVEKDGLLEVVVLDDA